MRRNMDVLCSLGFHRRSLVGFDLQNFLTMHSDIGQDFPNDAEVGQKMQAATRLLCNASGNAQHGMEMAPAAARCGR